MIYLDSIAKQRARPIIVTGQPTFARPDSQLVTASQFYEPEFAQWLQYYSTDVVLDRKVWEYCYIMNAIDIYCGINAGHKGLCFGSGLEFLPSIMAGRGSAITATDFIPDREAEPHWEARSIEDLFHSSLVSRDTFDEKVSFREVDMNVIPTDLRNFDFLWSVGSLEHIGSHANGLRFVEAAMDCLRPGGIAVHTTEFTLTSEHVGRDNPDLSFYCRSDVEQLAQRLIAAGHTIFLNFERGTTPADTHVDTPPYHFGRTLLAHHQSHVITSLGLIIQKGG